MERSIHYRQSKDYAAKRRKQINVKQTAGRAVRQGNPWAYEQERSLPNQDMYNEKNGTFYTSTTFLSVSVDV